MNNLEKIRGKKGITQVELAEKIGVTKAGISIAEKTKISAKLAMKCAEALGENGFSILGADALKVIPKTEEDKRILIATIEAL